MPRFNLKNFTGTPLGATLFTLTGALALTLGLGATQVGCTSCNEIPGVWKLDEHGNCVSDNRATATAGDTDGTTDGPGESTGPDPGTTAPTTTDSTPPPDLPNDGSSGGESEGDTDTTGADPSCGDGVIQPPEQCDGADLSGKTCAQVGADFYDSGDLACTGSCTFSTSGCTCSVELFCSAHFKARFCAAYPGALTKTQLAELLVNTLGYADCIGVGMNKLGKTALEVMDVLAPKAGIGTWWVYLVPDQGPVTDCGYLSKVLVGTLSQGLGESCWAAP